MALQWLCTWGIAVRQIDCSLSERKAWQDLLFRLGGAPPLDTLEGARALPVELGSG